jgi:hypothetical protein
MGEKNMLRSIIYNGRPFIIQNLFVKLRYCILYIMVRNSVTHLYLVLENQWNSIVGRLSSLKMERKRDTENSNLLRYQATVVVINYY